MLLLLLFGGPGVKAMHDIFFTSLIIFTTKSQWTGLTSQTLLNISMHEPTRV